MERLCCFYTFLHLLKPLHSKGLAAGAKNNSILILNQSPKRTSYLHNISSPKTYRRKQVMKNIFTQGLKGLGLITMMLVFTTMVSAQHFAKRSNLELRLDNNMAFIAWIDGKQVNQQSNRAVMPNLMPGNHTLKVVSVRNFRGNRVTRQHFNGMINIPANTQIFATIDMYRNFIIESQYALNTPQRPNNNDGWYDDRGNNDNCIPEPACQFPVVQAPQPVYHLMDAGTFAQLKNTINKTAFESSKMGILKQAIPYYDFSSAQVGELMNQFAFESTKLEVAKMMYDKVIDKQNYFTLNQEFNFSSSVDDLTHYLAQK